jgi:hypothetical protein
VQFGLLHCHKSTSTARRSILSKIEFARLPSPLASRSELPRESLDRAPLTGGSGELEGVRERELDRVGRDSRDLVNQCPSWPG